MPQSEARRDYMRAYMRSYRAKRKTVTPSKVHVMCDARMAELNATIAELLRTIARLEAELKAERLEF